MRYTSRKLYSISNPGRLRRLWRIYSKWICCMAVHTKPPSCFISSSNPAAVRNALDQPDVGLLLVTERLASEVEDELTGLALTSKRPLVLEIPDEAGPMPARTTVLSLVKEALGLGGGDE